MTDHSPGPPGSDLPEPSPRPAALLAHPFAIRSLAILSLAILSLAIPSLAGPVAGPGVALAQEAAAAVDAASLPEPFPMDMEVAAQALREARAACTADGGELWGVPLCGPFLFAEPESHAVVASQAPAELPTPEGLLTARGDLFVGRLPERLSAVNTAVDWAGTRWTLLRWPLPSTPRVRTQLLLHESFHRIQDTQLGLPMSNPANPHLDELEGRIWLQLEWRALARAVKGSGESRRQALQDALVFRHFRHELYPDGAATERLLEMNEGLAEDTGVALAFPERRKRRQRVLGELEHGATQPTFVRSFAYASGPALGFLLDDLAPGWRRTLSAEDDLGARLARASGFSPPEDLRATAEERALAYDGAVLRETETRRWEAKQRRVAELEALLITGPVLTLPLKEANVSFDPGNLEPLGDHGTVYPTMRTTDVWGVLELDGSGKAGALVTPDWSAIRVPAPTEIPEHLQEGGDGPHTLEGDGWSLELAAGWHVTRQPDGGLTLVR